MGMGISVCSAPKRVASVHVFFCHCRVALRKASANVANSARRRTHEKRTLHCQRTQSLNLSTSQPLNISTSQPLILSTSQPLDLSIPQPLNLSTSQPLNLATSQPLNLSTRDRRDRRGSGTNGAGGNSRQISIDKHRIA